MIDLPLFRDVLASEWTKLRSVRSTYWSILATVVLGIGLSAAIAAGNAHAYNDSSFQDRLTFDPTALSLAGLFFAQLSLGVFAILTVSAEYSTGTIRTSICAVPQRGYVLAAKALLVALVSFVLALAIAFGAFYIGQVIFKAHNPPLNTTLSHPNVLRAVFGGALYITALSLLAVGLAAMIRHSAGAITALVALVFIVPIVSNLLPDSWQNDFARYLPANAGGAITQVVPTANMLGPWTGYLVFVAWAAAAVGGGWYLLRRRDV